jgi:tetratricopeptide (TPR) repeat protein
VALCAAEVEDLAGNADKAILEYQRAIELGERGPVSIQRLVQLLSDRGRYLEADQALRKLPESAFQAGGTQKLAAETALHVNLIPRALEFARKAVSTDSSDYRDHLWLGHVLWAAHRPEEAEAALRQAVSLGGIHADPWVALVQHLARTSQKEKADAVLNEARKKLSADQARLALAQCHELLGQMDQAQAEYEAALAAQPDDPTVLHSVSVYQLRTSQPRKAEPHLRKLVTLQAQSPADARWARRQLILVLASSGDYERSREALALLGVRDGMAPPTPAENGNLAELRLLAVVLATQRERRSQREAIRLLEELATRQPPSPDDRFLLAQLYEQVDNWSQARTLLLEITASHPNSPQYLASAAQSSLRHQDVETAEFWLGRLEKIEPQSFRTLEVRARVLKSRGRDEEAVAILTQYAANNDANLGLIAALLESLSRHEAEDMYRRLARDSQSHEGRLLLAAYLGRQGRTREALDLWEQAQGEMPLEKLASVALTILYVGRARTELHGRFEAWLQEGMRKSPKDLRLVQDLAELRYLQGRYREAITLYRQILEQNSRNVVVMNNLAWLLALEGDQSGEALRWVDSAISLAGPQPELLDTRGVIYLSLGQGTLALADLERAVDSNPTASSCFHLARAQMASKNRDAAVQSLEKARLRGFTESVLHPLDQQNYHRLLSALSND